MKFDPSKAWNDATRLLSRNRDVVVVIAGVFFFLPYLAIMLLAPELGAPFASGAKPSETPEEAMAQLSALGADFFVTMIVLGLIQAVGVLGLLRLLTNRERPTVGEALFSGLQNLLPYIATQVLQGLLFVLILSIPLALALMSGVPALVTLAGGIVIVGAIFLFVRFSLISPVIAIDQVRNPLAALQRSWALTKGRAGSLLFFFVLLAIATFVIFVVASVVFGLVFAIGGAEMLVIGSGILGALINAMWVTMFMAVLAAVHRQLSAAE